jgi:hypothetical protein
MLTHRQSDVVQGGAKKRFVTSYRIGATSELKTFKIDPAEENDRWLGCRKFLPRS